MYNNSNEGSKNKSDKRECGRVKKSFKDVRLIFFGFGIINYIPLIQRISN